MGKRQELYDFPVTNPDLADAVRYAWLVGADYASVRIDLYPCGLVFTAAGKDALEQCQVEYVQGWIARARAGEVRFPRAGVAYGPRPTDEVQIMCLREDAASFAQALWEIAQVSGHTCSRCPARLAV